LGLIDFKDVVCLLRYAKAVINPSLFEGWSTTVEECKSIGKNMILSNIRVHREQNPPDSVYFDPHNSQELASIMEQQWKQFTSGPNLTLEEKSMQELNERTRKFSQTYVRYVKEVLNR
jgi:hypothetical protein